MLTLLLCLMSDPAAADPANADLADAAPPIVRAAPVPLPTLGGSQFWTDVRLRSGWRIQRQVFTGSHRLLDPAQLQHASGSLADCRAVLDCDDYRARAPAMSGEVTLLLHGILRGSSSMHRIGKRLDAAGMQPLRFDYSSTQGTIEDAAAALAEAIENLDPDVTRVNLVVHSMGGLVVRAYGKLLADGSLDASKHRRLGRLVMIGTPNHGAEMASHLKNFAPFQALYGPAGRQLATSEATIGSLPAPPLEFGIIAGHRGTAGGYNPFIPGDDDGTVTVESARLSGAADFIRIKGTHSFLLLQRNVAEATERFLADGAFRESGEREPIE